MITQYPIPDHIDQMAELNISMGKVEGQAAVRRFATSTVGTTEEVVGGGGIALFFPTAATTVRVRAGGNINDTAAGTGARTVQITGLDDNFDPILEVLTLAGAAASASTVQAFRRVNTMVVKSVGTYRGSNTGLITLETTGGTAWKVIQPSTGQSQDSEFCIAAGFTYYITGLNITAASSKEVTVYVNGAIAADDITAPFDGVKRRLSQYPSIGNNAPLTYGIPQKIPEKSDFWVSALTVATTAAVSVEYVGVLVRNDV